jgi:D-beta-D-heptose 7-phosphate kinase/D-beta-D-heptose 1-phosphate adenosyltransferase
MDTQQPTSFNVLLIGDSCTDRYNIGTVDRISPEAPVPILKIIETYDLRGMAANVKDNLTNLGIAVDFVTNNEDIIKSRYIDKRSGQHMIRVDSDIEICRWSGRLLNSLDQYDAVVISDYNKGFLDYEDIESIAKTAKCPVFIDTKKTRLADIAPPVMTDRSAQVYIKINELEFKNTVTLSENLIVTLGDRGAQYKGKLYPTNPVEVMDVCGAGDTFLAALTAQYLFTKDIEKAILFANIAAGLTVQHRGNYAPTYDEIKNARH